MQGIPSPDPVNIQMFVERTGFAHQVIITVTQTDGQKQQVGAFLPYKVKTQYVHL